MGKITDRLYNQVTLTLIHDIEIIRKVISKQFFKLLKKIVNLISFIIVMIKIEWQLSFFAITIMLICIYYLRNINVKLRLTLQTINDCSKQVNNIFTNLFIKNKQNQSNIDGVSNLHLKMKELFFSYKSNFFDSLMSFLIDTFFCLVFIVILVYFFILMQKLIGDPGKISAFYFVCSFQWQILKSLFMDFQFQDTVKSFTRILSLISLINKKNIIKYLNLIFYYILCYSIFRNSTKK